MKPMITAAAVLVASIASAAAQPAPTAPPPDAASGATPRQPPSGFPEGPHGPGMHRVPANMNWMHGPGPDGMVPSAASGPVGPMGGTSHPAHVHLQRADVAVDVTCRDDETSRECASVAGQVLQTLTAGR